MAVREQTKIQKMNFEFSKFSARNLIRFRQIQSVNPSIRNIKRRIEKYGPKIKGSIRRSVVQKWRIAIRHFLDNAQFSLGCTATHNQGHMGRNTTINAGYNSSPQLKDGWPCVLESLKNASKLQMVQNMKLFNSYAETTKIPKFGPKYQIYKASH